MKKVKTHAEKPAATEPEKVLEDPAAAGAEQEAAALVEGDGGAAAQELSSGQPDQPAPANDGSPVGEQGADVLLDRDVPFGDMGDGSALGQGWPDTVRDDVKFVAALPPDGLMETGDQVMTFADGVYTVFEWRDEPPRWVEIAQLGSSVVPLSADNDDDTDPEDRDDPVWRAIKADHNIRAAYFAMNEACDGALRVVAGDDEDIWPLDKLLTINGAGFLEAARFLREIGHARATTDVVATQLRLTGQLGAAAIDGPQKVLLEIFLFTLATLDAFAAAEADRRAREEEAANRAPAPATPIDETTMEPVDDTMATWG